LGLSIFDPAFLECDMLKG